MGMHRADTESGPGFDIALWGYDRGQVDRCVDDLTAQLDDAVGRLQSVTELQAQLCEANVEIAELQQQLAENPPVTERLSSIMAAAEQLWQQAARDAEAVRERAPSSG